MGRESRRGSEGASIKGGVAFAAAAVTATLAGTLGSSIASAADTDVERAERCERRGIARVVELRATPGDGLPCEVVYLKPHEGGSESTLWTASNDRAFCTARFEAFVVKLESTLGWVCEAAGDGTDVAAVRESALDASQGPSAARVAEDQESAPPIGRAVTAVAPRAVLSDPMPERPAEPAPGVGAAVPATLETPASADGSESEAPTPLEQLRALAPAGAYVAVPVPSNERAGDVRVSSWCPPAGALTWWAEAPSRAVFSLGEAIEFTVRLPDAPLDGSSVLPVVSSVGAGAARELQTLSPAPVAENGGRAVIDLRVAPRGPGSGALSPGICRYALDG